MLMQDDVMIYRSYSICADKHGLTLSGISRAAAATASPFATARPGRSWAVCSMLAPVSRALLMPSAVALLAAVALFCTCVEQDMANLGASHQRHDIHM